MDITDSKRKCPFCRKVNSGTTISRHNTVTRIMGTNMEPQGMMVKYKKKL